MNLESEGWESLKNNTEIWAYLRRVKEEWKNYNFWKLFRKHIIT
jgi:hypothetical protein